MTMKRYYIESLHEICEDDYQEGQGENVNNFELNSIIKAETPKEAIKNYFDKVLFYNYNEEYLDTENEEEGVYNYSTLVDKENAEASEEEKDLWRNGDYILYSNNISLSISELVKITKL